MRVSLLLLLLPSLASAQFVTTGGNSGSVTLNPARSDTAASYSATGPNGVRTAAQASPAALGTCSALAGAYASATPSGETGVRPFFCDGVAWRRVFTSAGGVLPNADVTVPGYQFVSQAAEGDYAFRANNRAKWDFGDGSSDECVSTGGVVTCASWSFGDIRTDVIANKTTNANISLSMARYFRIIPTGNQTCGTNDSGGLKAASADSNRPVWCDGTNVIPLARILSGSASIDLPEVAAGGASSAQSVTVTGAAASDRIRCEATTDMGGALTVTQAWAGTNTGNFYVRNLSAAPVDLAATTFSCWVLR